MNRGPKALNREERSDQNPLVVFCALPTQALYWDRGRPARFMLKPHRPTLTNLLLLIEASLDAGGGARAPSAKLERYSYRPCQG